MTEAERPSVSCRSVSIRRGDRVVIDDASLECGPGETMALLGANGAGKSTLLRAIGGTLSYKGQITLDDDDVIPFARPRPDLGYVSQPSLLDAGLDVHTMLVYHGRYWGMRRGPAAARADELIERLSLQEIADQGIGTLSGGQKQRAAVARALVHDPGLLLLDEPFTGIDVGGQTLLAQALFGDRSRTSIVVTHDVAWVEALDLRVVLLAGGQIAVDERARELVARYCPVPGLLVSTPSPTEIGARLKAAVGEAGVVRQLDGDTVLCQVEDYSAVAAALMANVPSEIREISVAQPSLTLAVRLMTIGEQAVEAGR